MSAEVAVALLAALGTFLTAMTLAYRGLSGDRFSRKVTESAALLTGYTEMVANLRRELDAIRVSHTQEIERRDRQHLAELANLALLHSDERERWHQERARLVDRLETLEAQVTALLLRPISERSRRDDDPA